MNYKLKKLIIKAKKLSIQLLKIVIGTILMAIGIDLFLVPSQLSTGGFSGIGTFIYYLWGIPVGTTMLILNIPVFLVAFLKLGRKFFFNAIIGTILLSYFLNVFENVTVITTDKFLAFIYGAIFVGIGTAVVLKANASTGGTELLANIIRVYSRKVKTGTLIVLLDTIIVGLNTIFFKDLEVALYSGLAIYLMGKVLDIFFEGIDFTKLLFIISPKSTEISDKINMELRRGTTALYGMGMYKKEKKNILLCVVGRNEVAQVRQIIEKIDKSAFLIITNAREVYGKGFNNLE